MKRKNKMKTLLIVAGLSSALAVCQTTTNHINVSQAVTLKEAHKGTLVSDTKLLDSYQPLPEKLRQFYLDSRFVFANNPTANFTHPEIVKAAKKYNLPLMGGPMLGQLREEGVTVWLRPSTSEPLTIKVEKVDSGEIKTYSKQFIEPGIEQRIMIDDLAAGSQYHYGVYANNNNVTNGEFTTAPLANKKGQFRLTFGSDFHKIGLHNPNIINQILKRSPSAMLLLGDNAVDDRENNINMHRADYTLRDVSKPWRTLTANVPVYVTWDDHDYFDNDLSGIPQGFTAEDRDAVRAVWHQNWNNPEKQRKGVYFNTRIGPVEIIMLDTRSYRANERRGKLGSYLGDKQFNWLKQTLMDSTAAFKIIASGTMWSDDISQGKDSWGTWDIQARETLFNLIETENIPGVLLISGDRHGARGLTIPRASGHKFYEFEVGTLGNVKGPRAMAKDPSNQLFGYIGKGTVAFGEFTFDTDKASPSVTFRLIDELGNILEKHYLSYSQLIPSNTE
ncbi:MAG: alkaline phosphatase D [Methylophagaceae bacterium]|jgi:alkaline phosphatase D